MRVPRRMCTSRALTEPWSPGFGSLGRDDRRAPKPRWRFGRSGKPGSGQPDRDARDGIHESTGGPRSRRAVGVGDVAGERRGDRGDHLRGPQQRPDDRPAARRAVFPGLLSVAPPALEASPEFPAAKRRVAAERAADLGRIQPSRPGRSRHRIYPQLEYLPGREWVKAGLVEPCYRGPQGYRRYVLATMEVWGGHITSTRSEGSISEIGSWCSDMSGCGARGAIPLVEEYAYIATLRDGLVARLQEFFDHDEALEAAGLSE